jgi:hypothetical protein
MEKKETKQEAKVPLRFFSTIGEAKILLESTNPEQVYRTIEDIKLRGDLR